MLASYTPNEADECQRLKFQSHFQWKLYDQSHNLRVFIVMYASSLTVSYIASYYAAFAVIVHLLCNLPVLFMGTFMFLNVRLEDSF